MLDNYCNSWDNYGRINQINGTEAIQIALRYIPGEVLKVELDTENGILIYEITIRASAGEVYEVKINANTGEVLEIEREFD
ncbi:PepSY domain-containing protein [Tissierella carlieri]|uniref:PepSY domain-containing protein n=1 Tax=Tissierella carlieri TaxID=689904 RepID=UPI001C0FEC07|nr:PepSY domain-containing protein [Tissierella carlieri]MBU5314306.1 PepSY domain-containing protein [Tissierella carlieri]